MNYWFEKIALLGANKVIGVSDFVSQKTKTLFNYKRKIDTIYNTIDVDVFYPNHEHIKSKTLLYFGTLVRKKGVLEIPHVLNISIIIFHYSK